MSASQCRCLGPTENGGVGRTSGRAADAPRDVAGGRRAAIGLLGALFVLGAGLLPPNRSRAQEAPAKAEVPKESEPAKVQDSFKPLGLRYRFIETYGTEDAPAKPGVIGPYKVGSLETVKSEFEKTQGAPDRDLGTIRAIYTERPAKVTKLGEVTDLVRHYDDYRFGGGFQAVATDPPPVKDLSIWCHFLKGGAVEFISLTKGRSLRDEEINAITDKVFLSQLSTILPPPVRVGDTWPIARRASRSLLGKAVPDEGFFQFEGTLVEVRKAAEGTALDAVIEITGELELDPDPDGVVPKGGAKARIIFTFEPPAAEAGTRRNAKASEGVIEARGWISKVQMARTVTRPNENDGRLMKRYTRELNLVRRATPAGALALPEPIPVADEDNSWILYDDPEGRFHFRHPQELMPKHGDPTDPNRLDLVDPNPSVGKDVVIILWPPKDGDTQSLLSFRNTDALERAIAADWQKLGVEVVPGGAGWLPEADWAPLGRKVYHLESAAKLEGQNDGKDRRLYKDDYLVLFKRDVGVRIEAMTIRDDHGAYLKKIDTLIRSFDLGPSKGSGLATGGGAAPAGTAPTASPGRRPAPPVSPGRRPAPPIPEGRPRPR